MIRHTIDTHRGLLSDVFKDTYDMFVKLSCPIIYRQAERTMNALEKLMREDVPQFEKDTCQYMITHLARYYGPSGKRFKSLMLGDEVFQHSFHASRAHCEIYWCLRVDYLPSNVLEVMLPFKDPENANLSNIQQAISAMESDVVEMRSKTILWRVINAASITNKALYSTLITHLTIENPLLLRWQEVWKHMYAGPEHPHFDVLSFQHLFFIRSKYSKLIETGYPDLLWSHIEVTMFLMCWFSDPELFPIKSS